MSPNENESSEENCFIENLTMAQIVECLSRILPCLKKDNVIVDSEYRLTLVDLMELLIALLITEIQNLKHKKELHQRQKNEKVKHVEARKSIRKIALKKINENST